MAQRTTPRYFAGRRDEARDELPAEIDPTQVIDNFFVGGRVLTEQEWAVTVDPYGRLQGWVLANKDVLAPELQGQLAYNDVACASRVRCLDARNFWLFHMQLLEQPSDAPGLNDPVYLYGTLYGPYPEAGAVPSSGIEGQLTVTRADLLDGIVTGSEFAFKLAPEGETGPASRAFNVLLPGDRDEEIAQGSGLVMMYPLHPAEMINTGIANELIVAQLLYDVLSSLKDDVVRNKVNNPLRSIVLPVPNRFLMEANLIEQGYKIKNGVAVRNKAQMVMPNQKHVQHDLFTGMLQSVFGDIALDKLELPPEGTVDDLIAIARDCIYKLPGWPPPRTVALRKRCQPVSSDVRARAANAAPLRDPIQHAPVRTPKAPPVVQGGAAASGAPQVVSQPGRKNLQPGSPQPAAWMQDFIDSHQKKGSPPPRITCPEKPVPPAKKDWLKDFE